jgi:hypothetical protein
MRKSFKSIVAGAVALCVVGVISAVGATSASAAPAPFDPTQDTSWIGTVTFYNAAGQVVTSGDATNPLSAQYMVGSATPPGALATTRTTIGLVGPQPSVNPGLWSGANMNGSTLYPLPAPAPAVVSSATTPQGAMLATSQSFAVSATAFTPNTGVLANVFQIRLRSVGTTAGYYNATTIYIDPVTNIWTQIDPVPVNQTATTTSLTVTPASPAAPPVNPTLDATVGPTGTAGSVQFFNGATSLGTSPVVANHATLALTAVPVGNYSLTATFTPTDAVAFASSTSSVVPYVVQIPKTPVTVGLSASASAPNLGVADTFTANASATGVPAVAGTFQFFDGVTSLGAASATTTLTTSSLALGAHSITAQFVPTDTATYNNTTSPVVLVNVLAIPTAGCSLPGSVCTDAQPFVATVPAGSIIISTPYTATAPFNLGTMVLNTAGTQYTTSNAFGSAANPAQGVTITDTRAGGLGWTASLQSGAFTNNTVLPVGTINGGNLGFTTVAPQYISGNALNVAPGNVVSVFNNVAPTLAVAPLAAASGLANPQKFASAAIGAGSVNVTGLFTLNAPSSVPAGLYGGTVTFTIA